MKPNSVFLPYEKKGLLEARAYDLPLFEDIDLVRQYMFGEEGRKLSPRKITYVEHFDNEAIAEFMARKKPS